MPVNLDKLTELMAGTTSLPWFVHPFQAWICPAAEPDTPICAMRMATDGACSEQRARDDSELIVAAVNALPDLLALQAEADRMRGALEEIGQFSDNYFAPWGSWKTAWWEGEVSDDVSFDGDNALKHVVNIARKALEGGAAS